MKFEEYISGTKVQQYQYKNFFPSLINMEWTWEDPRINRLLEEASASLAELNAYSRFAPDVDRYIRMHVVKEANTSVILPFLMGGLPHDGIKMMISN